MHWVGLQLSVKSALIRIRLKCNTQAVDEIMVHWAGRADPGSECDEIAGASTMEKTDSALS